MIHRTGTERCMMLGLSGALALAGCAVEQAPNEEARTTAAPIVNGDFDTGHPAVVALTYQGQSFCSGTLVTPTVVVTAAHCIHPSTGLHPGTLAKVYFGNDVQAGGTFIDVIESRYKPDFFLEDPEVDDDVAVLRLAEPAPAPPIPMADLPPDGTQLTLVGFGITSSGGSGGGVKRVATATINGVYNEIFEMPLTPSGTCNGDSGGTALWNDGGVEKLVGIHTRSDCESFMLDERVDVHIADFIQPFLDAGGACVGDGACATGCPQPDPDCPCADDGYCTIACFDVASDPDCDPGCAEGDTCVEGCPLPDPDCSKCAADGICDTSCASDPDCNIPGDGGGGAGPIVDEPDDDDDNDDVETEEGEGCAAAPTNHTDTHPWLAAALLFVTRRRRRKTADTKRGDLR